MLTFLERLINLKLYALSEYLSGYARHIIFKEEDTNQILKFKHTFFLFSLKWEHLTEKYWSGRPDLYITNDPTIEHQTGNNCCSL